MPRNPLLIGAIGLVLAASACGSSSAEDQIKSSFSNATSGLAAGDGSKFCSALTPAAQKAFSAQTVDASGGGAGNCAQTVSNLLKATKALAAGDWAAFCTAIGPRAAASIAASGPGLKVAKDCTAAATAVSKTPQGKAAFAALGAQLGKSLDRLKKGTLDKITVSGDKAVATITPSQAGDKPVKFEKVNGTWLVSG